MKTLFILLFLLCTCTLWGQTNTHIEYTYDQVGNRYLRHLVYITKTHDNNPPSEDSTSVNKVDTIKEVVNNTVIAVYPNPAKEKLYINITGGISSGKIILTDVDGKVILEKDFYSPSYILDISKQPSSTYFMTIYINNNRSEWKIIKN